jgi:hypothetical protein
MDSQISSSVGLIDYFQGISGCVSISLSCLEATLIPFNEQDMFLHPTGMTFAREGLLFPNEKI